MSLQATTAVWNMTDLTPTEKLVLLKIADHADKKGRAWPSINRIAAATGLSRSTVCQTLNGIEGKGFLTRDRGGPSGHTSTRYCIKWSASRTSPGVELVREPDLSSPGAGLEVVREPDPNRNKPSKNRKGTKSRGSIEDFRCYAREQGMPESDGEFLRDHFEANGWKNGRNPVRDWRASFRKWKAGGWLPSQKNEKKPEVAEL